MTPDDRTLRQARITIACIVAAAFLIAACAVARELDVWAFARVDFGTPAPGGQQTGE